MKHMKEEVVARPIVVVKPAIGEKNRYSPLARESIAEKKLKTSSTTCEGSAATEKLVII